MERKKERTGYYAPGTNGIWYTKLQTQIERPRDRCALESQHLITFYHDSNIVLS